MTTDRGHVTRVQIQLRHRDMDSLGHLNQSLYHTFLEESRATILKEILGDFGDAGVIPFVLVRVELDIRREIPLSDREVTVEAWVEHVGTSSVRLGAQILKVDGTVAAEGSTVLVAWDPGRRGSRKLEGEERQKLLTAMGAGS